jgi:hypothetical protein
MKSLMVWVLTLCVSSQVLASSKICFGAAQDEAIKDSILGLEISDAAVTVQTIRGSFDYTGVYMGLNTSMGGKNGRVALEFAGKNSDIILIDQVLFADGPRALLYIRNNLRGYSYDWVFSCRDARANARGR